MKQRIFSVPLALVLALALSGQARSQLYGEGGPFSYPATGGPLGIARSAQDRAGETVNLCDFASCSGQQTTGTITGGSNQLALAAAIDFGSNPACTRNGCGIVIGGAGPSFAIAQPVGLAVASSCATATGGTGNLRISSKAIKGVNSLASISVGDSISGTGIPNGTTVKGFTLNPATILLSQAATATNTGVALTWGDPCNIGYWYRMASYDAAGGIGTAVPAVATMAGPVNLSTWNVNCLTWTRPGGTVPAGYVVWRSLDGVTYHFFQMVTAEGSGTCAAGSNGPFWDGGQPAEPRPWWIPDTPTTLPQPDFLRTTITNGAGSLDLTLAAAALNSITNGFVAHDDTGAWTLWASRLNSTGAAGFIPALVLPAAQPAQIRVAATAQIMQPNIRIRAERGATILPFGAGFTAGVLSFAGGGPTAAIPLSGNMDEASACLRASGLPAPGAYVLVSESAPGGLSQSQAYVLISQITAANCENGGVRLADAAPITFDQTTTAAIAGTPTVGDTVSLTADSVVNNNALASPTTVTYTVVAGETPRTVAAGLAAAVNANAMLSGAGISASSSSASVYLQAYAGVSANWTTSQSGGHTTNTLSGPQGAVIAGTPTAGDTVSFAASGDLSCTATYTVASGDTAFTVARGLALAINSTCGNGVFASNTYNLIHIMTPATLAVTWTPSATGGHMTNTAAFATGAVAQVLTPLVNVGVDGLHMDARDAAGAISGPLLGIYPYDTALGAYTNLQLANFSGGAAFYDQWDYANIHRGNMIQNGSGGTPNITSFSDYWIAGCTKTQLSDITEINPSSFGGQLGGCSHVQATNISERGAWFGRGFKLGAVVGSSFTNLEASGNVFDGLAICCGTTGNLFSGLTVDNNNFGVNYAGIAFFDAYSQYNSFTTVRAIGNVYDIYALTSDRYNLFNGVMVGTNQLSGGGYFPTIYNLAGLVFYNLPGCAVAAGTNTPLCVAYANAAGNQFVDNQALIVGAHITDLTMPTSCTGQATGTLWNSGGTVHVC
jgi:hypothetical protein